MPTSPGGNAVPLDLVNHLSALFARMLARGIAEPLQVYARVPNSDGKGQGRSYQLLTTLSAYVETGGGSMQLGQEGQRASETEYVYLQPDNTGSLTEQNYTQRWVALPNRSAAKRRIATCQQFGPYFWLMLDTGGTSAAAGNVR